MRRGLWALLLVAGCFTPDLGEGQVACGAGGECPPDYVCRADGRCYHGPADGGTTAAGDLLLGSGGGGDLASCVVDGTRVCVDATHSAVCTSGVAVVDRDCPPTSTCGAGRCMPPPGARSCARVADCMNGEVCDEYAVGASVMGFCTPVIAGAVGGSAAPCTAPGWDDGCKTGLCAGDAKDGTVHACLYPCKGDGDCGGGGAKCQGTIGQPATIEGAPAGGLRFCTNNGG